MIKVFLFFFGGILELIVDATNSKGCEEVVHVKEGGKWIFRPPKLDDPGPAALERRPR